LIVEIRARHNGAPASFSRKKIMPDRIAKEAQEYNARPVAVGEKFHVEPEHVDLLLLLGRIEREDGDAAVESTSVSAPQVTRSNRGNRSSSRAA